MGYEQILYEVKDRVATITLNRPDKLNAWTAVMGREVRQAMDEAARDEAVRVIVLTGAGRGLVVSLYCDRRIAADTAVFTTAFSRRGLIAEHGVSWLLPRLVGLQHGLDLLLSARKITAAEALAMGLVAQVKPAATLQEDVRAYAREMADLVSPRSLRVMKRQIWEAQFQSLAEATAVGNQEMQKSFSAEDFKEGEAHFVEKRAPRFTGR